MIVNVDAEVNKHKGCRDRNELEKHIQEYKSLALQYAKNFTVAGQYNMVAQRLQAICDRLPAPNLKNLAVRASSAPVKTATITSEEDARIKAAWKERAGHSGPKR
jgi:hypothetical protein